MSTGAWERIRKRREHRWSWRRISDYVDGALTPAERGRLRRHADICEECGPLLRSLLWLVSALRMLGAPPEESIVPGVLERLRAEGLRAGPR
jgi:hypothetical protein